jgi:hypothetical protein
MSHYLIGLVVGATGALIGVYAFFALLPATREERPRDPLPGRRDPKISGRTWWEDGPSHLLTGESADVEWTYTFT